MEEKDITDPNYIGPGAWVVLHKLALSAHSEEEQREVIEVIKKICQEFPCHNCSEHCQRYITDNPPEDYIGVTVDVQGNEEPVGMFLWTWLFHNDVNVRLGKKIISWETAYNLYHENEMVCSSVCMTG